MTCNSAIGTSVHCYRPLDWAQKVYKAAGAAILKIRCGMGWTLSITLDFSRVDQP